MSNRRTVAAETGTMWPIQTTSTGKAMLATLPRERRRELVRVPLSRFTSLRTGGTSAGQGVGHG